MILVSKNRNYLSLKKTISLLKLCKRSRNRFTKPLKLLQCRCYCSIKIFTKYIGRAMEIIYSFSRINF